MGISVLEPITSKIAVLDTAIPVHRNPTLELSWFVTKNQNQTQMLRISVQTVHSTSMGMHAERGGMILVAMVIVGIAEDLGLRLFCFAMRIRQSALSHPIVQNSLQYQMANLAVHVPAMMLAIVVCVQRVVIIPPKIKPSLGFLRVFTSVVNQRRMC